MSIKLYNVLSRKKEEFIPLESGIVKMYACGITASGEAHVGHAFQAIVFDVIKKYLEYSGYKVTYVRNYTDVDDKIIIKARELGVNPMDYANKMMNKIDKELAELGIERPTIQSKATECIPDMINFIQQLIDTGHAYSTPNGDVFFDVSTFKEYGKLSNRTIEDGLSGVRKDVEPGKKDDKDFALWKNAKDDEIFWKSPWGLGRPGWHIECSTMSMKYLGETIDIHGGGRDLIFPHHENEITQSESLTGKQFSKYWIHNGLIKVNGQKMSKSLGNGILLGDLLKEYNSDVIRMTLLENNYKSDLNIVDGIFDLNEKKIYTIYKTFYLIDKLNESKKIIPNKDSTEYRKIDADFRKAMDNDFNTSLAIANINEYINEMNKLFNKNETEKLVNMKFALISIYNVLGLLNKNPKLIIDQTMNKYMNTNSVTKNDIEKLIEIRKQLKDAKKYEEADKIRNDLLAKGISIKDSGQETEWDIVLQKKIK